MKSDTMTMITEQFENDKTGDKVCGVTIIIDGKIKEVFDRILSNSKTYSDYTELLRDAVFIGVNEITKNFPR